MALGPLVPHNNGYRDIQPAEPTEILKPVGPGLYNVLPSQDSALREYLRVLIKRKWIVLGCAVGIFAAVALVLAFLALFWSAAVMPLAVMLVLNIAVRYATDAQVFAIARSFRQCAPPDCHGPIAALSQRR
jgi:hypothetical protein